MELYTCKDIRDLESNFDMTDGDYIVISVHGDDTHFDGYADVYDATVSHMGKGGMVHGEYDAVITHRAAVYYHHGDD